MNVIAEGKISVIKSETDDFSVSILVQVGHLLFFFRLRISRIEEDKYNTQY